MTDTTQQASEAVVALAGGTTAGSLNHYDTGGGCMVTTVQVDEWVYVVGQDDFSVAKYALAEWLGETDQTEAPAIEADDATQALELLNLMREDAFVWQCGGCDGWIFTTNRPRVGVLNCSTCGDGGIDFRHADRHVGSDDSEQEASE